MRQYNDDIANYIEKVIIPYTLAFLIRLIYVQINYNYVLDNKLIYNQNVSEKDIFNLIKNKYIYSLDGDIINVPNYLKSNNKLVKDKRIYKELFERYPTTFSKSCNIYELNRLINYNMIELLKKSTKTQKEKQDINSKHSNWNISSFDARKSYLFDDTNNKKYRIDLSIANLNNGKKITYAKKRAQAINNYKRKTDNRSLNSPPVSCTNNLTLDLVYVNYNYSFKDYYNYIIKLFNIKNINYKLVKVITFNLLRKKFKLKILKYKPLIIESI